MQIPAFVPDGQDVVVVAVGLFVAIAVVFGADVFVATGVCCAMVAMTRQQSQLSRRHCQKCLGASHQTM